MSEEIDFDAEEIAALKSWLQSCLSSMSETVGTSSGHSIAIDIESLALKEEGAAKSLIPADAMTWGMKAGAEDGVFIVLTPRDAALALNSQKTEGENAPLTERLADEASLNEEEQTSLTPIRDEMTKALIDCAKSACSAELTAGFADFLVGSAWGSGTDPIPESACLVAETRFTIDESPPSSGFVLLSPDLVKACFEKALIAAAPEASGDGQFLFFSSSSELKDKVIGQMGSAPKDCASITELMQGILEEETRGVVVGVGRHETHLLSLLRGLNDLPNCQTKQIVVVLEDPTTANVVRCGRLGLFRVLPQEFDASDFQELIARPE